MPEQPNQSFENATFNAPVNFASNYGNQAQHQNIQNTDQHFDVYLSDFKQLIAELQTQYPDVATPEVAAQTIEAQVKQLPKTRLQNLLSLKRLWNGGKSAGIKVAEHFAEESVWGKGAIAFLEGASEDV